MACELRLRPRQTAAARTEEVREAAKRLAAGLTSGRVKAKVSKKGAIAFEGFTEDDRNGISDECAYRRIMSGSSQSAKLAILRAEQIAGVSVSKTVLASGVHSHDGGQTWDSGH